MTGSPVMAGSLVFFGALALLVAGGASAMDPDQFTTAGVSGDVSVSAGQIIHPAPEVAVVAQGETSSQTQTDSAVAAAGALPAVSAGGRSSVDIIADPNGVKPADYFGSAHTVGGPKAVVEAVPAAPVAPWASLGVSQGVQLTGVQAPPVQAQQSPEFTMAASIARPPDPMAAQQRVEQTAQIENAMAQGQQQQIGWHAAVSGQAVVTNEALKQRAVSTAMLQSTIQKELQQVNVQAQSTSVDASRLEGQVALTRQGELGLEERVADAEVSQNSTLTKQNRINTFLLEEERRATATLAGTRTMQQKAVQVQTEARTNIVSIQRLEAGREAEASVEVREMGRLFKQQLNLLYWAREVTAHVNTQTEDLRKVEARVQLVSAAIETQEKLAPVC